MAASLPIEDEQGSYVRTPHSHNGYYAGDFGSSRLRRSWRSVPVDARRPPSNPTGSPLPSQEHKS
jgi:hypothetical protein